MAIPLRMLVLTLASIAPGCLFITGVGEREGNAENPYFGRRFKDEKVVSDARLQEPLASSKLFAEWGEPDDREVQADGSERWRYNGFLRGAGVFAFVLVLPIPLVIPTGLEHVDFTIRDGKVVHAHSSANSFRWGWGCGISFVHGGGPFAGSISEPAVGFCNPFE
jgi:hypothetical protein